MPGLKASRNEVVAIIEPIENCQVRKVRRLAASFMRWPLSHAMAEYKAEAGNTSAAGERCLAGPWGGNDRAAFTDS
jgi:hypothetical protein